MPSSVPQSLSRPRPEPPPTTRSTSLQHPPYSSAFQLAKAATGGFRTAGALASCSSRIERGFSLVEAQAGARKQTQWSEPEMISKLKTEVKCLKEQNASNAANFERERQQLKEQLKQERAMWKVQLERAAEAFKRERELLEQDRKRERELLEQDRKRERELLEQNRKRERELFEQRLELVEQNRKRQRERFEQRLELVEQDRKRERELVEQNRKRERELFEQRLEMLEKLLYLSQKQAEDLVGELRALREKA
ncbi:hypothetical protein L227DRAFT_618037 [Lentinus tigrinus ALCF2SS1-6]|uniref:Uncharacterized protein n=2 Tax=Lentinus tigrinus ALCF2SS1-6 TaxID=1328759 RepID=A0A5C2RLW0_9APHY|nr:hypothetical protein L227DRAFT_618037 [Lentinus tigrinus ALCF2SS1-6]